MMNRKRLRFYLFASTAIFFFFPASLLRQRIESSGMFGTLDSWVSTVRNATAFMFGGRGGWIFDHTYAIGIGGYILTNHI
jgi:hypothetical protein